MNAYELLDLLEDSFHEGRSITVAWHDPGFFEGYYRNADIFGFELWDVPSDSDVLKGSRIARSYDGLFSNLTVLHKKDLKQFNATKQRVSFEINRVSRIYIPDSVWRKLKISEPRKDQILFMQCLYIIYKAYNVRLVGMEDRSKVSSMKENQ